MTRLLHATMSQKLDWTAPASVLSISFGGSGACSLNQRLLPPERSVFHTSGQARGLVHDVTETSLVDLLWTVRGDPAVQAATATLCARQQAEAMTQYTGRVIEMFFFGQQSPGHQRKARLTSYEKKRISINQLMQGEPWLCMSTP